MKQKYTNQVNINITKNIGKKYDKYNHRKLKLFTNDIKIAILTLPTTFLLASFLSENSNLSKCLYILSGSSLVYATTNLYLHKKVKQKRFTIK